MRGEKLRGHGKNRTLCPAGAGAALLLAGLVFCPAGGTRATEALTGPDLGAPCGAPPVVELGRPVKTVLPPPPAPAEGRPGGPGAGQPPPGPAETPVVPPGVSDWPVDLETAWALAGVSNPTIGLAREAINASLARLLEADSLLLPSLNAGMDFHLHRGNLQGSAGLIRDVNEESLYAGGGVGAVGAGTVGVPMVRLCAHLGDAYFEPVAARQEVANRQFTARATENQVLLDVTVAYFELVGAEVRLEAVRLSQRDLGEVVRLTTNFARTGRGRQADADRARARAGLLRGVRERVEEEVAVASTRLARLLSLDPAVRLKTPGGPLPLVQLAELDAPLEQLVEIAVANRPEVAARAAQVAEAQTRVRQEIVRPLVPLLSVGYSAGVFGGGSNLVAGGLLQPGGAVVRGPRFDRFDGRQDFDVFAVWTFQNAGLGNLALTRRRRAEVGEAIAAQTGTVDRVAREVAEARARALAARQEINFARAQVRTAQAAYEEDLRRTRGGQGRPIELLDSVRLLTEARQDLVRAVIAYDEAQFALFVALGQPPFLAPYRPGGAGPNDPHPPAGPCPP
jgi:outer membrane protein TolC